MKSNSFVEVVRFLLISLSFYNALDAAINFISIKNLLQILPITHKAPYIYTSILVGVQALVALLLFLPRFKKAGFFINIMFYILLLAYVLYTSHTPHKIGGVFHFITYDQIVVTCCSVIILSAIAFILLLPRRKRIAPVPMQI